MTRRLSCAAWCAVIAVSGIVGAAWSLGKQPSFTLIIGGDTRGYLAPCGCTSPMTGGIKRLGTAVRQLRSSGNAAFIENGGLISEEAGQTVVGAKQNELKAQALAEAFGRMGVAAINLDREDARDLGMVSEVDQLSMGSLVSTSLTGASLDRWKQVGPCLVGGVVENPEALVAATGATPVPALQAATDLVNEAARLDKEPVVMLRAGLSQAEDLAKALPRLKVIVYSATGSAPPAPEKVGDTLLVTPGDRTKDIVRIELDGGRFSGYRVYTLTPDYADDPVVSKVDSSYLRRVAAADFIDKLPRVKSKVFACSKACLKCHRLDYRVWHGSAHAHALRDLEKVGHDRDPDCLGCHVTGLTSFQGFYSRKKTPGLADVNCESCHGPGAAHVAHPKSARLLLGGRAEAAALARSCKTCHSSENSPGFLFKTFWKKIAHH